MRRWERWSLHGLTATVTLTGLVYFWMKDVLRTDDPMALVNHPLQPLMLQLHILSAPFLILIVGIVFQSHVAAKIRSRYKPNRRSGLLALTAFGVMTLSGYLLQVATSPLALRAALIVHLLSGGIFAVAYLVHLAISVRVGAAQPAGPRTNGVPVKSRA